MREISDLFAALDKSTFRRKFRLKEKEQKYFQEKGEDVIRAHAEDIIRKRLAPANLSSDGKQTPMRGHPVFIAQHATATCCRGCLQKWHHIQRGRELNENEIGYVIKVLLAWLDQQEIPQAERQSDQLKMEM
ncbi:MAG: DUF4186 domain-containing protein [Abditibacteriaceae bacterium]